MISTTSTAEEIVQWLLDHDFVTTRYDKNLGQLIEITDLGKKINEILNHMRKEDQT